MVSAWPSPPRRQQPCRSLRRRILAQWEEEEEAQAWEQVQLALQGKPLEPSLGQKLSYSYTATSLELISRYSLQTKATLTIPFLGNNLDDLAGTY